MSIQPRMLLLIGGVALLAACGGGNGQYAAAGTGVGGSTSDPAIDAALNDAIVTDPDLSSRSNADAVRPEAGFLAGAVPQAIAGSPAAQAEARKAEAEALRAAGGRIERTPVAAGSGDVAARPVTLGAMAREQSTSNASASRAPKSTTDDCGRSVTYGPEWAGRLPAPFALYPRANLVEAAGVSNGRCQITIASFTTPVALDQVLDYYYTQARRAGYDAEHIAGDGEHRLGGTRGKDGAAYLIFGRSGAGGTTEIDIVANIG